MKPGDTAKPRKKYRDNSGILFRGYFMDSDGFPANVPRLNGRTTFIFLGIEEEWKVSGRPIAKVLLGDRIFYVEREVICAAW